MVSLPDRRTAVFVATVTLTSILGGRFATAQEAVPTPFGATVEVTRILTEVRVVDRSGEPVQGLTVDDFKVSIDGRPVTVESVLCVPTSGEARVEPFGSETPSGVEPNASPPEPRLIVVVFQTDINLYRLKGVVRMAPEAAGFVRNLGPDDRVALFAFESHLELRSDFTADHEAVADMLTTREILNGRLPPPEPSSPSLSASFDPEKARRAATLTSALEVIGRSLIPIPGPKTVVLFGWGLGRYNVGHSIIEKHSYGPAIAMLAAARASVFSLDITTADYHTLELGLRRVSHDTGGVYSKTNRFPGTAIAKLTRTITSYYELSIVPPPDLAEAYEITVKVRLPATEVYVRQNTLARW